MDWEAGFRRCSCSASSAFAGAGKGRIGKPGFAAVHREAGFSRSSSGSWVSPQFVSQDETTGLRTELAYFIGTGLLSRRFM